MADSEMVERVAEAMRIEGALWRADVVGGKWMMVRDGDIDNAIAIPRDTSAQSMMADTRLRAQARAVIAALAPNPPGDERGP